MGEWICVLRVALDLAAVVTAVLPVWLCKIANAWSQV